MPKLPYAIAVSVLFVSLSGRAQTTTSVQHFSRIIISPHIQVTFVQGSEEEVIIEKSNVPEEKIHCDMDGKTLWVYLDGAREFPKGHDEYSGTEVRATIHYKKLDELSLRGNETQVCQSLLQGKRFRLRMYGNPRVLLQEVDLKKLHATIYGDGSLEIARGFIGRQRFTTYGESRVNSLAVTNDRTRITAYGEAHFRVHASHAIRIVSFGEAAVAYTGDPTINKWLHLGDLQVSRIE